ncbi:hypothetical protein [Granulicella sp. L60]|uniref:hypothetical protein n=1 Tax=Granulicella sp. L60 TaxID=1641866 RepID=UPI00131A6BFB|nr:hypothetical protein [Granulicella sp. L60]
MAANIGIDAVRPMSHPTGWCENLTAQIAETITIDANIEILFFMPAMLSHS